jgi:hypothetical protein
MTVQVFGLPTSNATIALVSSAEHPLGGSSKAPTIGTNGIKAELGKEKFPSAPRTSSEGNVKMQLLGDGGIELKPSFLPLRWVSMSNDLNGIESV